MSKTYKDRRDYPLADHSEARIPHWHEDRHRMRGVLRYAMSRYVRANARGDVEQSARYFAAVDRSARILSALD